MAYYGTGTSYSGVMNAQRRGNPAEIQAASLARNNYTLGLKRFMDQQAQRDKEFTENTRRYNETFAANQETNQFNRDMTTKKYEDARSDRTEGLGYSYLDKGYGNRDEQLAKVKPLGFTELPGDPGSYLSQLRGTQLAQPRTFGGGGSGFAMRPGGQTPGLTGGRPGGGVRFAEKPVSNYDYSRDFDPELAYDPRTDPDEIADAQEIKRQQQEVAMGSKKNIPSWLPDNLLSAFG